MNQYQTKKFKTLQKKWYDKLKKEGFQDIESDENNLKEWTSVFFSRRDPHRMASRMEYFSYATRFLNDHEFADNKEKTIWELHSNGKSFTEIAAIIKKKRYKRHNRSYVYLVIKDLVAKMYKTYGITK